MYLLDTNHCSRLLTGDVRVSNRIRLLGNTDVVTSVIVKGELLYMAQRSRSPETTMQAVLALLADLKTYRIDSGVAQTYAVLKAAIFDQFAPKERAKLRHTTLHHLGFGENDLWIAATALRFGLIVVSEDRDFKRIADVASLQYETWLSVEYSGQ